MRAEVSAAGATTWVELVRARAAERPDRTAYTFLADGEEQTQALTYGELDRRARALGAWLLSEGLAGSRVLLLYPPGLEFVTAFLGCFYAGAVAVPAYPPGSARTLPRLLAIARDARPALACTTSGLEPRLRAAAGKAPELREVRRLATDQVSDGLAGGWSPPRLDGGSLAFLQYTSGSTAAPKGVMVTHGNLLHNEETIRRAFGQSESSVVVSWLPLYHDMGLIGGVLQPLYVGARCVLMPPTAFLQRPARWLAAITRYRATTSGGPDFAYDLCVRKVGEAERSALDLSSWQVAFNGAEPVRAATLRRFAAAFAPHGFDRRAFYPCYGLAEATLFVAGGTAGREPAVGTFSAPALERGEAEPAAGDGARDLVGCGGPWMGHEIAVADPETGRRRPPGRIGEIWVAGPSVARGYWNRPEATAACFGARLEGEPGAFLRTGDLGFVAGGELFVTGRLKDLIILRGRNLYPQDLEATAERAHPLLTPGCSAAFAVEPDGEERLAIVCELDRYSQDLSPEEAGRVAAAVRRAVAEEHEAGVHAVVLLRTGGLPRTSSGKVQRDACRAGYLAGTLAVVGASVLTAAAPEAGGRLPDRAEISLLPPDERRERLVEALRARVGGLLRTNPRQVMPDQPLTALGLDSLAATELANEISEVLGHPLGPADLLGGAALDDLAETLAAAAGEGGETVLSEAAEPGGDLPLSHGQKAVWFVERLAPTGGAYNIAVPARVAAGTDAGALRQALQGIVDRHPALRTAFQESGGEPFQRVWERAEMGFEIEDARGLAPGTLAERIEEEAWRPFDLSRPPLLRARLWTGNGEDVLLLVIHHLVVDFWSLALLAVELGRRYDAAKAGRPTVEGPPAGDGYGGFVGWQRRWLASPAGERAWEFWRRTLEGDLPDLALPTDRRRPAVQTYHGDVRALRLDGDLAARVRALGRRRGATLYATLLATFLCLLRRYSGQDDLILGSPMAGRPQARFAPLVGYFVNSLPLRASLPGDSGFLAVLDLARGTALDAVAHQHYPLPLLVDRLQPARDASRTPLFQAMFVLQSSPAPEAGDLAAFALQVEGFRARLGGLELESLRLARRRIPFDLTLTAAEAGGELAVAADYNTDLFDTGTIERLLGHFSMLLASAVEEPARQVSELALLTAAEQAQLLEWSGAGAAPFPEGCLHELFAIQARRAPEAAAVAGAGRTLTYGELDTLSDEWAHRLRSLGTGPETVVGICLERSPAMIVALLAVLKAGGAVLPLDPAHPLPYRDFLLRDSGARVLMTRRSLAEGLSVEERLTPVFLEEILPGSEAAAPIPAAGPGNLAYVIYTSGSTGVPKGVGVEHGPAALHFRTMIRELGLAAPDRVLQFASPAFDVSLEQIFATLLAGATLVLYDGGLQSPAGLWASMTRAGVTVADLPTSYWQQAVSEPETGAPPGLRLLIAGGEAMATEVARRWSRRGEPRLLNAYGPTEAVVTASLFTVAPDLPAMPIVPIGRPLDFRTAHVLDPDGRPLPAGIPGELCLGGVCLARGYLGRPELTAGRFVPDPFGGAPGARLYRTGDRVRWRADGQLEFLGRIDHQVKVRGFRVELGEIESALRSHPSVREAVVLAREEAGHGRLIAWVVAEDGVDAGELRTFLRAALPEYMVPAVFVPLSALPVTPNGKVDRRRLPAPAPPRDDGDIVPPRNAAERMLAEVWREVLGVGSVGAHDNFFDLGGDSILSLQVVSRAGRRGLRLTPRQLFQHQTVAELAAVAEAVQGEPEERGPVSGAAPLIPVQRWFFERELADPHHYNQAVLLRVREGVRPADLERAVAALVEHHDMLRARYARSAQGWSQEIAPPGGPAPFTELDLESLPAAVRGTALETAFAQVQASLDLSRGPLLRTVLVPGARRFLLVIHHLVVDAVSWRILAEDLAAAYGQGQLPARATSFRDWAAGLAELAAAGAFAVEADFWLSQAEDAPRLPAVLAGGGTEASAVTIRVELTAEETVGLLRDVPAAYRARADEALLAALALAFRRRTGSERLWIDLEGHGREEARVAGVDLSRTVGWFTTLYPVLLDLAGAEGPGEALKAVKERLRRVPGRGIGYGVLRYLAAPPLPEFPDPEVSFNYLGQLDAGLAGDALFTLAPEPTGPSRSSSSWRAHAIEIDGGIAGGRLFLDWTCDRGQRAAVEELAAGFGTSLCELIAHCRSPEAGGLTPSDVPLARLDAAALQALAGSARDVEDVYPLSPVQEGILFHVRLEPDAGVYFEQMAFTFEGDFDAAAFERAWRAVVARHPVLRSGFHWEGLETPLQVVRRRADPVWRHADWRDLPADEQRRRLEDLRRREHEEGFDLARAPLLRFHTARLADDVHAFLWSHHHLILDGWSWPLVLGEVFTTYAALRRGEAPSLPAARPFRDYIAWLQERDLTRAETWWRSTLGDFRSPTRPAADRGSQGSPSGEEEQGERRLRLEESDAAALRALVRRHQLTLGTLVQGAWALLLGLHSGNGDVVFGAAVSGRPAELDGVESMVGIFINVLPVRVRLGGDAALVPWLARLQEIQAEQQEHEHSPLVRVREWSGVPAGQPLFETLLVFENYPLDLALAERAGLRVVGARSFERTNYPLALSALPHGGLTLELRYDCGRFADVDAARMLGHLAAFLQGFTAFPEARPADLPWMSAAERQQLLVEWNDTPGGLYPCGLTLHGLFEAWAACSPEAPAVSLEGIVLTYAELDRRAERLAGFLRELGVGPGELAGLCAERSLAMMVGLLGILKAGAAYVPLDPAYPSERLAWMIADSGVRVLLTQERLEERLPPHRARVVRLDAPSPESAAPRRRQDAGPDGLAYVIYTSGSTGQPKGAMNSHRGIVNRLLWMQEAFALSPRDRVLQKTPVSFDVSVWELFWPLATGACLVLARPGAHGDPSYLVETIERERVTTLHFVPSMLQAFAEAPGLERCASVERVIASGEALPADLARRVLELLPGAALHNLYGPTEAAVDVTVWTCVRGDERSAVPIGRPVAKTAIHLLDAALRPVPAGVPGELYIGGAQVGRGYLGRPGLTAERFVPDPFSAAPGARLYRTGDLARHADDGAIEYLGRADFQVKLRGFRIELGEIETALAAHSAVREAVVVAREDRPGDPRLVAYLVAREGEDAPGAAELRDFVAGFLPDHMVPSAFVVLEEMPLSPSGKVDRRALPPPPAAAVPAEPVTPPTPAEELLAGLWCEVLGIDRVGPQDSFFLLGGHSLLATRLVSRIRQAFGVELPLRRLFEVPVLAAQAREVEEFRKRELGLPEAPPIRPRPAGLRPPLSFAQQRLWFLDRLEPGSPLYNIRQAARVAGPLDIQLLALCLTEVARRHEALRTVFAEDAGGAVQVVMPPGEVPLPLIDLAGLPAATREAAFQDLAGEEARRPYDLERGPLFRAAALRLGELDHALLASTHHIVSDGWSVGLLTREVSALYEAFAAGRPSPLPEPPVQYADFAVWQRDWLRGDVLARQLGYWRGRLAGVPVLELPADRPRPPFETFRGAELPLRLPLAGPLRELARREGATPFMLLLAVFQALLARYTGSEDVPVGTPIANRHHPDVEGVIGFFVNTLVLRTGLTGAPTIGELLVRVREVALEAYAHQDVPFERLVEELATERDLSRNPLFQVMLELENQPLPLLEMAGLRLTPLELGTGTSKFDLTLSLTEGDEELRGWIEYNTDLFDGGTIERLRGHFLALLSAALEAPETRVPELPLLSAAERLTLLAEWRGGWREAPVSETLAGRFARLAAEAPDAEAVRCEGQALSYGELDRRSNRLARHLQDLGVGPEVTVGLLLERGLDLVTAVLGVLKAGGAYVPLDPTASPERLGRLLRGAGARVLLTHPEAPPTPAVAGVRVVDLAAEAGAIGRREDGLVESGAAPENAAYVIFTSGSTGEPKGVVVTHAAVARLLDSTQDWFGFGREDVWTLFHSIAFDFSVWELWGALGWGGRLVVVPYWVSRSPEAFHELLASEGVTVLNQTPSAFRQLAEVDARPGARRDLALRWVIFGGEALDVRGLAPWFARHPESPRLANMYGITETTVHVTLRPLGAADTERVTGSPIGGPIPDLTVCVTDFHLGLAPVGVPGELCVGGAGLARGYLGRPDLTAARFVPDPFAAVPGARLYRSGDLVRFLASGELEYLGRIDHQVKIRGFRIELGEIESALRGHPAVREAVVLAQEEPAGQKRLVAWVAAGEASNTELREHLRVKLPEYMMPAAFVFLPALPLTVNGKVDRRRLPSPEPRQGGGEPVAPRGAVEEALARIWREVLGLERVGADDNFFNLGGDSILSLQVVSLAGRQGLRLTPRQIFQHPTLAELATVAETSEAGEEDGSVSGPAPLTPIQRWFFERDLPAPHHFNQAVLLEVREGVGPQTLQLALAALVERHDMLRARYTRSEPGWHQEIAPPGGPPPFTQLDLEALPAAARERALETAFAQVQASLDLAAGPLLRAVLADGRLLLAVHHLAVDGVSWRILLEDLAAACACLHAGRTPALPARTTSFQRWAERVAEHASGSAPAAELDYWLALEGRPGGRLPLDRPGGGNTAGSADTVELALGPEETSALLHEVPETYRTRVQEVLLAALALAFPAWTGGGGLRVDLEGHGREELEPRIDLSRTVGWFTAIYPVLLADGADPGETLKEVKENLQRIPGQGTGYGRLRYLGSDRVAAARLAALPRADVLFNYWGQLDRVLPESAPFAPAAETVGPLASPAGERSHALEISCGVREGRLRISFEYSRNLHRRATVEEWSRGYRTALRRLLDHCRSADAGGVTPSDFPLVSFNQSQLDRLVGKFNRAR